MSQNLQQGLPPTPAVPIVDKSGNLTGVWYSFFVNLWNRTGGATGSISSILDNITNIPGSILFRSTLAWIGLDPGEQFQVLTVDESDDPSWSLLQGANFAQQPANEFLAAPVAEPGTPRFRSIASPDLVSLEGQYPGTATNDNGDAGNIGQYINSQVSSASAVALVSGAPTNITEIELTPGDWDIWGSIATTAVVTSANGWINMASAMDPTAPNSGAYATWGAQSLSLPVGMMRLSLDEATTLFLSLNATFSASVSAYGFLGARRRR